MSKTNHFELSISEEAKKILRLIKFRRHFYLEVTDSVVMVQNALPDTDCFTCTPEEERKFRDAIRELVSKNLIEKLSGSNAGIDQGCDLPFTIKDAGIELICSMLPSCESGSFPFVGTNPGRGSV